MLSGSQWETYKDHGIADLLSKDGIPLYGTLAFEFIGTIVVLRLLRFVSGQASLCIRA